MADQIVRGMRALGVAAWWDEDMRGVDWQQELEHRIGELAGVLVIWTEHSMNSVHVRDEARLALETDKLVNVLAGVAKPPFPYDRINGLALDGWNGREPHRGWTRLVETIEELVVQTGAARAGDITVALAMREQDLREKEKAVATATAAVEKAERRQAEADAAAVAGEQLLEHAQEQLQRVAQMRVTPMLLKAAQQEFDAALAVKEKAEHARRSAQVELDRATTALGRASEALDALFATDAAPAALPPRKPSRLDAPVRKRDLGPIEREAPAPIADPPSPARAAREPATSESAPEPAAPVARNVLSRVLAGPWLAAGGVVALAAVAAAILLRPQPPAASAAVAVAPPPAAIAAPISAAASLAGRWMLPGTDCGDPVVLAVTDDQLTMSSSGGVMTGPIEAGARPGMVRAHFASGDYTYALRAARALSMTGPSGPAMSLKRCAG